MRVGFASSLDAFPIVFLTSPLSIAGGATGSKAESRPRPGTALQAITGAPTIASDANSTPIRPTVSCPPGFFAPIPVPTVTQAHHQPMAPSSGVSQPPEGLERGDNFVLIQILVTSQLTTVLRNASPTTSQTSSGRPRRSITLSMELVRHPSPSRGRFHGPLRTMTALCIT